MLLLLTIISLTKPMLGAWLITKGVITLTQLVIRVHYVGTVVLCSAVCPWYKGVQCRWVWAVSSGWILGHSHRAVLQSVRALLTGPNNCWGGQHRRSVLPRSVMFLLTLLFWKCVCVCECECVCVCELVCVCVSLCVGEMSFLFCLHSINFVHSELCSNNYFDFIFVLSHTQSPSVCFCLSLSTFVPPHPTPLPPTPTSSLSFIHSELYNGNFFFQFF